MDCWREMENPDSRRQVPAQEVRIELKVSNSRFLATLAHTPTIDEAKGFVNRIREEFSDATHNVSAYIVGHPPTVIAHCHDDGEPSGTAGRPALAVLQGSAYGDVAVVVTRYFGGTKLGTGGLVRAYGDAVRQVLTVTRPAVKVSTRTAAVTLPYNLYDVAHRLLLQHNVEILNEDFGVQVCITGRMLESQLDLVQTSLREISSGTIQAETVITESDAIVPMDAPFLRESPLT
jgi:uncharacterized YigZ family protein